MKYYTLAGGALAIPAIILGTADFGAAVPQPEMCIRDSVYCDLSIAPRRRPCQGCRPAAWAAERLLFLMAPGQDRNHILHKPPFILGEAVEHFRKGGGAVAVALAARQEYLPLPGA